MTLAQPHPDHRPEVRQAILALDEDRRHLFEERAAILEYDARIERHAAEVKAWREVRVASEPR